MIIIITQIYIKMVKNGAFVVKIINLY